MSFKYSENKENLLFIPLGGTSEIGLNCSLYHYNGKWIMVDLGLGFADKDKLPGIDIAVPDLTTIEEYKDNIEALVLTHAHEDHIGAIQYVWEELGCKIYANAFTKAVLDAKLSEYNVNSGENKDVVIFENDKEFSTGTFDILPVGLSHSVPDMSSLLIKTEGGNIYHTGDWKMDHDPVLGTQTREETLQKIGKEGVLALVSDSTNIFNEGKSGSEGDLAVSLKKIVGDIKEGIVVITTFASNIARVKSIYDAATASGRKVAMLGRSLHRMYNAAKQTGYLDGVEIISEDSISSFKREELVVIATGCQGEENASIAKLSSGEHRFLNLNKKDTVIFASKIIPGNDKRIFECMNNFAALDIKVMTEQDHFVHVSGHPSRDEVEAMYKALKPKFAIPVHGETMHIHEHARFAREVGGVKASAIADNGVVLNITEDEVFSVGKLEPKYLAVDGNFLTPTDSRIFNERNIMKNNGILLVSISIDRNSTRLRGKPYIIGPGLLDSKTDMDFIQELQGGVTDIVKDNKGKSISKIKSSLYSYLGKMLRKEVGKRPLIEVLVD